MDLLVCMTCLNNLLASLLQPRLLELTVVPSNRATVSCGSVKPSHSELGFRAVTPGKRCRAFSCVLCAVGKQVFIATIRRTHGGVLGLAVCVYSDIQCGVLSYHVPTDSVNG